MKVSAFGSIETSLSWTCKGAYKAHFLTVPLDCSLSLSLSVSKVVLCTFFSDLYFPVLLYIFVVVVYTMRGFYVRAVGCWAHRAPIQKHRS